MYPIKMEFKKKFSFYDTLNSIGVYIIWDTETDTAPTYIGNGRLNGRLPAHISKLKLTESYICYAGLIYTDGSKRENKYAKIEAEIVEALLLKVASEIDRWPRKNTNEGNMRSVEKKVDEHGLVRVTIRGYDPLTGRRLSSSKYIKYGVSDCCEEIFKHSWRCI